jgi:hypothetical protein
MKQGSMRWMHEIPASMALTIFLAARYTGVSTFSFSGAVLKLSVSNAP